MCNALLLNRPSLLFSLPVGGHCTCPVVSRFSGHTVCRYLPAQLLRLPRACQHASLHFGIVSNRLGRAREFERRDGCDGLAAHGLDALRVPGVALFGDANVLRSRLPNLLLTRGTFCAQRVGHSAHAVLDKTISAREYGLQEVRVEARVKAGKAELVLRMVAVGGIDLSVLYARRDPLGLKQRTKLVHAARVL